MKYRVLLIMTVFIAVGVLTSSSRAFQSVNQTSQQVRTATKTIDLTQLTEIANKSNMLVTTNGVELLSPNSSGEIISHEIKVPLDAPEPFLALSAMWRAELSGSAQVLAYVRTRSNAGDWGEWIRIQNDKDKQKENEFGGALLLLNKDTAYIQLKANIKDESGSPSWISSVRLFFISPGATDQNTLKSLQQKSEALQTDPVNDLGAIQKPSVVSRTAWGCPDGQGSRWSPQYTNVTHLIIHHTVGSNTSSDWPAVVKAIWSDHTLNEGWGDIGYNYLIDPNGIIYEGRGGGDNVIGAHFSCANGNTMGVAALGTFTSVSPTQNALSSLKNLLAWKAEQRSIDPLGTTFHSGTQLNLPNISGHRDGNSTTVPGTCPKSTACPGTNLYNQLATIRSDVKNLLSGTCSIVPGQGTSGGEFTAFQNAYNQAGGRTVLGCATAQVRSDGFASFAGTIGHYQTFSNGDIEYHVNGNLAGRAFALVGPFSTKWAQLGFTINNPLGYPTTSRTAGSPSCAGTNHEFQSFEGGSLTHHLSGSRRGSVYEVHGAIHAKWSAKGFANCPLGLPTSDERNTATSGATGKTGRVSDFERGHIHWWTGASQAFETHGAIDALYMSMGGAGSWLGFPTSDEYIASTGRPRSDFEGGFITTSDGINYQAVRNNCSYSITSTSQSFSASGSSSSVGVNAGSGCPWTAVSNNSFITITSGGNGSGNGTVNYSVAQNTSTSQRSGTITIAGRTFTITQSGASCSYSINPSAQNFAAAGGNSTVGVTSGSGCSWSAVSNSGFLTITSGSNGSGNGSVGYSVATNTGGQRSGTMTIAGRTFNVTQDAASITGQKAVMTSPTNGSTFSSGTVTFNWTSGSGASGFWLYLGSSPGAADLYNQDLGSSLSRTVSGLPTDGRNIHATLWSFVSSLGGWVHNQYTYKASQQQTVSKAVMISPANGSTFNSGTVTFNWNAGSGASGYWLYLGSSPGAADLYNQDLGTSLSRTVSGLPTDGRNIHATLWSFISSMGGWVFNQYDYKAFGGGCIFTISPTSRNFSSGGGVSSVAVTAGSGCGWSVVSNSGFITVTSGSNGSGNGTVSYSVASNGGTSRTGTITIAGKTFTVTQDAVATGSGKSEMISPSNNATFNSGTVTFSWTSGIATNYWLYLGNSPGAADLYHQDQGTNLSRTVSGLPTDGRRIYATLWSFVSSMGGWVTNQYTYTASGGGSTVSAYTLNAPATAKPGSIITVNWTAPSGHSANDWVGLYRPGAPDTSFISFQYIPTATSGTLNFVAPAAEGGYEFRSFLNNGYTRVATSNPVTVSNVVALSSGMNPLDIASLLFPKPVPPDIDRCRLSALCKTLNAASRSSYSYR